MNGTFSGVLRGCLAEMPPFTGYRREPDGTIVPTLLGGYVFDLIVKSMNIKHVALLSTDKIYAGTFPNGSWGGPLGMIDRNECDLALGPIVPTFSRFQVARPLPHYSFVRVTPCGGTQRLFKTDVFAYVTALDPQVWAALLATLVLLAVLLSLPASRTKTRLQVFWDQMLELFGNMVFESSPEPQETSYGRWLTSFWWIVVMVVMTGFTGIMKANMLVKDQTGRINTIQDIIARPNLRPLVISGSTYEGIFKRSDRPDYQRLWRQVLRWNGLKTAAEMVSKPVFDIILEEKAAFFCDDTMLYMTVARLYPKGFDGEFYMGNDYFINNEFTMFIRRGLDQKIIDQIHKRLRWLWEAGLPQEWKRKAMESARSRSAGAQTTIAASNMKLTDVGAIFYLLILGHGCACLGVLAEMLTGRLVPVAARTLQERLRRRAAGSTISRISPLTSAG